MNDIRSLRAAVIVLLILQGVMLLAMMTETAPHPPLRVPPFALGPFLGASLAVAAAMLVLDPATWLGRSCGLLTVVLALVSFGPQKWFDPLFGQIWPAVILGQIAAVRLVVALWQQRKAPPA